MDENKHPVYDNRTEDKTMDTVADIAKTGQKIIKTATPVVNEIKLLIMSPFIGIFGVLILLSIVTSLSGGHIELSGLPVILLLAVPIIIVISIQTICIIHIIKAVKAAKNELKNENDTEQNL